MNFADKTLTTIITWMAASVAVLVGLGLPLAYFGLSYFYQNAELTTEAEINARIVTQLINENPEMWSYEQLRLEELMKRRPDGGIEETRRILDLNQKVIAESAEILSPPVIIRRSRLLDSGRTVGTIEIQRSMFPLLIKTALLAIVGCLFGFAAYTILRTIPLRVIRQAIQSLYDEKERAQVTLRSIGDGVITTDVRGNVVIMNGVAEKLTGWTHDEAQGKPLREVFRIVNEKTREACESPVDRVLSEMRTIELDNHTVLLARDGTERIIADSGAPIKGAGGSVIGVVLVFRDETEKRRLVEESHKTAKLESLGVLAGGIAHDFNNLLGVTIGNISIAMLDLEPDGEVHELLVESEKGCLRARDLTYQLLTFAKGGTPVKENVALADLIRSSADFVLRGSNVSLQAYIEDDLPSANVDAGQIHRVMHNLMINAIDAMPDGGVVSVHADHVHLRKEDAIPLPEGEFIRISVRDEGIGIPKEHINRIFDPYFSTKKKGSGLGLTSAFSIVRNHDGHITVDSGQGRGTTFHLYLPVCSSNVPKQRAAEDSLIRGRGTILLMDDEEAIRDMAGEMLRRIGYEVVLAGDGSMALDRLREARASGKPFDAVILDLTVPGGMGGRETIQKMLEADPGVKAIVSSGYADNAVMSEYTRYGFQGVMSKPYDIKKMSTILHQVLHGAKS